MGHAMAIRLIVAQAIPKTTTLGSIQRLINSHNDVRHTDRIGLAGKRITASWPPCAVDNTKSSQFAE